MDLGPVTTKGKRRLVSSPAPSDPPTERPTPARPPHASLPRLEPSLTSRVILSSFIPNLLPPFKTKLR
ncbi:unnamed protein product [Parajaminaea phylloscopi]